MSVLTERVRRALQPEYEVLGEIGSGGMGVVYRARDTALARAVASQRYAALGCAAR